MSQLPKDQLDYWAWSFRGEACVKCGGFAPVAAVEYPRPPEMNAYVMVCHCLNPRCLARSRFAYGAEALENFMARATLERRPPDVG